MNISVFTLRSGHKVMEVRGEGRVVMNGEEKGGWIDRSIDRSVNEWLNGSIN